MTLSVRTAGTRQVVSKLSVFQGGGLRPVRTLKVMTAEGLRLVAAFSEPLSLFASPSDVSGYGSGRRPVRVYTDPTTATPSGGFAPYSYAWTTDNAGISVSSPTAATTKFSGFNEFGTAQCVVTDAIGSTAIAIVSVAITFEIG